MTRLFLAFMSVVAFVGVVASVCTIFHILAGILIQLSLLSLVLVSKAVEAVVSAQKVRTPSPAPEISDSPTLPADFDVFRVVSAQTRSV